MLQLTRRHHELRRVDTMEKKQKVFIDKNENIFFENQDNLLDEFKQYTYNLFTNIIFKSYNKVVTEASEKIRVVNIEIPLFDCFGNMVSLRERRRYKSFDASDVFIDIDNIYFVLWYLWSAKCSEEVERPTVIGIREICDQDKLEELSNNFIFSLKDLITVCAENEFELKFLEKTVIMYPNDYVKYYKDKNIKIKVLS